MKKILFFVSFIIFIDSCKNENSQSVIVQEMKASEDTILQVGFIAFYDKDVKHSLFIPLRDTVAYTSFKMQFPQSSKLGLGFQFYPAEISIWNYINYNREKIFVQKVNSKTKEIISDTLNILYVKAVIERKLRNLPVERIYEDTFKIKIDNRIIDFRYTNRYLQNIIHLQLL